MIENHKLNKLKKIGFQIIGASKDPLKKNIKFAEKNKINYFLASDETDICEKLGIWIQKSMFGIKYFGIDRTTIIIDSEGKVFKFWKKVKVSGHVKEVLEVAKKCP